MLGCLGDPYSGSSLFRYQRSMADPTSQRMRAYPRSPTGRETRRVALSAGRTATGTDRFVLGPQAACPQGIDLRDEPSLHLAQVHRNAIRSQCCPPSLVVHTLWGSLIHLPTCEVSNPSQAGTPADVIS